MSMQDFFERIKTKHAAQVSEGEHDAQCEWRANGHFLCHCPKRKREAAGQTTPPGPLHYGCPTCPRCYTETYHDGDSFVCDTCSTYWDPEKHDDDGTFNDDHGDLDPTPFDERAAAEAKADAK